MEEGDSGAEREIWVDPPGGITFIGPFNETKVARITLENPTDRPVIFKMKSTRKKRFEMVPGFGFVDPGERTSIAVSCNPFKSDHLSTRDRFTAVMTEIPQDRRKTEAPIEVCKQWKKRENTKQVRFRRHVLPVIYYKDQPQFVRTKKMIEERKRLERKLQPRSTLAPKALQILLKELDIKKMDGIKGDTEFSEATDNFEQQQATDNFGKKGEENSDDEERNENSSDDEGESSQSVENNIS